MPGSKLSSQKIARKTENKLSKNMSDSLNNRIAENDVNCTEEG